MPKGKHKGGRRMFTNFEQLEEQKKKELKEKQWRREQGETDSEEEEEDAKKKNASEESSSEEEEEEESGSSSEEETKEQKAKGVANLIATENPNRVVNKPKKVTAMDGAQAAPPKKAQLSRREREEIEKQRATAHYRKLHAEGKTEEARADLARLAIIRQQREEAAKKREEERKAKEEAAAAKKDQLAKVLNKKTKS